MKLKLKKTTYPSNSVKYLGVRIDRFLDYHNQVDNIE